MTRTNSGPTEPIRWKPISGPIGTRPRGLITTVAIVVGLIAAIAMANGAGQSTSDPAAADNRPTVEDPHSRQGAQDAAARIVSALGSERMFTTSSRHDLVDDVVAPSHRAKLQAAFDDAYTAAFNQKLGLTTEGNPPKGATFVNRMLPAGVTVQSYSAEEAVLAVWGLGLFGLTGPGVQTEIPVSETWHTTTVTLHWTTTGWRLTEFEQTDGPEPAEAGDFGEAPQL